MAWEVRKANELTLSSPSSSLSPEDLTERLLPHFNKKENIEKPGGSRTHGAPVVAFGEFKVQATQIFFRVFLI